MPAKQAFTLVCGRVLSELGLFLSLMAAPSHRIPSGASQKAPLSTDFFSHAHPSQGSLVFLIVTFASSIAALNHSCEDFIDIPVGALSLMVLSSELQNLFVLGLSLI